MKKLIIAFGILALLGSSCSVDTNKQAPTISNDEYVTVEYAEAPVNVAGFEYLNTSKSSFVGGAWYDSPNQYMLINLSGTVYQHCGLSGSVWNKFKSSSSFGSEYNKSIKDKFDC